MVSHVLAAEAGLGYQPHRETVVLLTHDNANSIWYPTTCGRNYRQLEPKTSIEYQICEIICLSILGIHDFDGYHFRFGHVY